MARAIGRTSSGCYLATEFETDICNHDEFLGLAGQLPNVHHLPTLSRPHEPWHGLRGYAQQQVPDIVQLRADGHAYICGLDKMVKANRQLLDSLDWDRKRIGYEQYD
jgi:NAD(P)H-flavin reductase